MPQPKDPPASSTFSNSKNLPEQGAVKVAWPRDLIQPAKSGSHQAWVLRPARFRPSDERGDVSNYLREKIELRPIGSNSAKPLIDIFPLKKEVIQPYSSDRARMGFCHAIFTAWAERADFRSKYEKPTSPPSRVLKSTPYIKKAPVIKPVLFISYM